jgi:hypothetical protein
MSRPRSRSAIAPDAASSLSTGSLLDFYREELLRHRACLEAQREYYSELAILEAEEAIARVLTHLDGLIPSRDCCARLESLLRTFDQVTGLSGWTDPSRLH